MNPFTGQVIGGGGGMGGMNGGGMNDMNNMNSGADSTIAYGPTDCNDSRQKPNEDVSAIKNQEVIELESIRKDIASTSDRIEKQAQQLRDAIELLNEVVRNQTTHFATSTSLRGLFTNSISNQNDQESSIQNELKEMKQLLINSLLEKKMHKSNGPSNATRALCAMPECLWTE